MEKKIEEMRKFLEILRRDEEEAEAAYLADKTEKNLQIWSYRTGAANTMKLAIKMMTGETPERKYYE